MSNLEDILLSKSKDLVIYSPVSFLRDIDPGLLAGKTIVEPLLKGFDSGNFSAEEIKVDNKLHYFIYHNLPWDTRHFGFPVYRIEYILFDHNDLRIANSAINTFIDRFVEKGCYWFMNVPSDDILLVQALCSTPLKLVETRLDYYFDKVQSFESQRYPVRFAGPDDIDELGKVAAKMRNKFDRVHADPAFTTEQADAYLGTFAEESVRGFADYVIIPDVKGAKPFGFLAGNKPVDIMGKKISKLVLTAIDSSVERGWLFRLVLEIIHLLKNDGAEYITSNTQGANRRSIRAWERSGFKLKAVTHIFSIRK